MRPIGSLALFLLVCADAQAYVPGRFYARGHTDEKRIALTFDDGPGPITPQILDFLKDHHIRATFFMEGTQVERYASIARQVAAAGHEIGNHTYAHFNYRRAKNVAPKRLVHELQQTEASLRRALRDPRFRTRVVRMPYGYFNRAWLLPTLKAEGYALVHWSCGQEKAPPQSVRQMADAYIAHARPGDIFLFHDGGRRRERTLEAVKMVIDVLESQGYRFMAAEDLLKE